MSKDTFIINVVWDRDNLPPTVGPFESREEAMRWGQLNIPNGVWDIAPLSYPYYVSADK